MVCLRKLALLNEQHSKPCPEWMTMLCNFSYSFGIWCKFVKIWRGFLFPYNGKIVQFDIWNVGWCGLIPSRGILLMIAFTQIWITISYSSIGQTKASTRCDQSVDWVTLDITLLVRVALVSKSNENILAVLHIFAQLCNRNEQIRWHRNWKNLT